MKTLLSILRTLLIFGLLAVVGWFLYGWWVQDPRVVAIATSILPQQSTPVVPATREPTAVATTDTPSSPVPEAPTPTFTPIPTAGPPTIYSVLANNANYSAFFAYVELSSMEELLNMAVPDERRTLLVPTNDALLELQKTGLLSPPDGMDADSLKDFVAGHLLIGDETIATLMEIATRETPPVGHIDLGTYAGVDVTIWSDSTRVKVDHAEVITEDDTAVNGVVLGINGVLLRRANAIPAPDDLAEFEVWEPYPAMIDLPIGDAALVPGDPRLREALKGLAQILVENKVQDVNIARAVRLEEEGTIYTIVPRLTLPEEAGDTRPIGVIMIDGELKEGMPPGAYLVTTIGGDIGVGDTGGVILISEAGEFLQGGYLQSPPPESEDPFLAAGIAYGTSYCAWGGICYSCWIVGNFPTLQACQSAHSKQRN